MAKTRHRKISSPYRRAFAAYVEIADKHAVKPEMDDITVSRQCAACAWIALTFMNVTPSISNDYSEIYKKSWHSKR